VKLSRISVPLMLVALLCITPGCRTSDAIGRMVLTTAIDTVVTGAVQYAWPEMTKPMIANGWYDQASDTLTITNAQSQFVVVIKDIFEYAYNALQHSPSKEAATIRAKAKQAVADGSVKKFEGAKASTSVWNLALNVFIDSVLTKIVANYWASLAARLEIAGWYNPVTGTLTIRDCQSQLVNFLDVTINGAFGIKAAASSKK
jgi:hypothetical protein